MAANRSSFFLFLFLLVFTLPPFLDGMSPWPENIGRKNSMIVSETAAAFSATLFPVRWLPNLALGLGSPYPIFESPAFFELATLFPGNPDRKLAFSSILFIFLGGAGMFLAISTISSPWAALAAGILYVYCPFRSGQILLFGDFSGYAASAVFPWLFVLAKRTSNSNRYLYPLALSCGLLFLLDLSGWIGLVLFVPFFFLFFERFSFRQFNRIMLAVMLGVLMSSTFWLPCVAERQYIQKSSREIHLQNFQPQQHFLYPSQWFSYRWGDGISLPGPDDNAPFQLGVVPWVLVMISSSGLLRRSKTAYRHALTGLAVLVILLLFTTRLTETIWEHLPLLWDLNYPWRIQWVSSAAAIILGISVFASIPDRFHAFFSLAIIWIALALEAPFYVSSGTRPVAVDVSSDHWALHSPESNPEWLKPYQCTDQQTPEKLPFRLNVTRGKCKVLEYMEDQHLWLSIKVEAETESEITTRIAFFPGWKIWIDQEESKGIYSDFCSPIRFTVPAGKHDIDIRFQRTAPRFWADVISSLALISTLFLWCGSFRRRERPKS